MVQNWRATFVLAAALATILAAPLESALAQPSGAPTDCTEATWSATIFIGHDCGQWASVMIAGRIEIRKPWSRANGANRGVRLRLKREGRGQAPVSEPTAAPAPALARVTQFGIDVTGGQVPNVLDCGDLDSPEAAQALWDEQGWSASNDPYNLDGDADDAPCEG